MNATLDPRVAGGRGQVRRPPSVELAARWFGFDPDAATRPPAPPTPARIEEATPRAGELVLLTGPSGGGKSTLLAGVLASATRDGRAWVDVSRVRLRPVVCLDQFGLDPREHRVPDRREARVRWAMNELARAGLAEASVYVRLPHELSEGQRWRLKLAVATARLLRTSYRVGLTRRRRSGGPPRDVLLACDEFAAVLDRVTACVVARSLRRTIDRLCRVGHPAAAIVATSHDDLRGALLPDRVVTCDGP